MIWAKMGSFSIPHAEIQSQKVNKKEFTKNHIDYHEYYYNMHTHAYHKKGRVSTMIRRK